jgi:hypothetical protein
MAVRRRHLSTVVLVMMLALLAVPLSGNAARLSDGSRSFPETGKSVQGKFLEYWDEHGGLAQQGYPISNEMQEKSETDGKTYTVQYFERAVFELHPENQAPNDVLLSLLGNFLYKQKYPSGAPNQKTNNEQGSRAFPETSKRLGGIFLDYWTKNGGLAQQGLPISDEFQEKSETDGKTYTVQYFERAVFEHHPEHAGSPYEVLLSQLGTFRYKAKYATATAPTATAGTQPTSVVSGGGPSARAGHDLVYHDVLKMVLLVSGGDSAGEPDGPPTTVGGWNGVKWQVVSSNGPPVRSLGGAAYDPERNRLVLFGGGTETTAYNETWEWDGAKWEQKAVEGPGYWHHGSMVYDAERREIVLYGGNVQAGASMQTSMSFPEDTWAWDGKTWKKEAATGFGNRYHYAMGYDNVRKRALLFGGSSGRDRNDLWAWDGSKWTQYSPTGDAPSARTGVRMAFDERAGKMVLFGGLSRRTAQDDTWTWDGTKWTPVATTGTRPPARSHHAMAYDRSRGRIVVFGGVPADENSLLADTWEWDGTTWAKVAGP